VDLCRRLATAGYEVWFNPTAGAVHYGQLSSRGAEDRRMVEHWRSMHRYWRSHHSLLGRGVACACFAAGFAGRAAIIAMAAHVPRQFRPDRWTLQTRREFSTSARYAFRMPSGEGLRELAQKWNGSVD
jgi:GT2 family glycosyltransferase